MAPSGKSPYLISPSALQRVTALIDYLATHRNAEGVTATLAGQQLPIEGLDPESASTTWTQIAQSHIEFFEAYLGTQGFTLRLRDRHQQAPPRPPLTMDRVAALHNTAERLHSEALSQSGHHLERSKMWVSALTALAGAVMGSLVTYLLTGK